MLRYVYQLVANCVCLPFTTEPLRRASGLFFPEINMLAVAANSHPILLCFSRRGRRAKDEEDAGRL